jgi:hypothetical protein
VFISSKRQNFALIGGFVLMSGVGYSSLHTWSVEVVHPLAIHGIALVTILDIAQSKPCMSSKHDVNKVS